MAKTSKDEPVSDGFLADKFRRALHRASLNLRAIQLPPPSSRLVDAEEARKVFRRALEQEFNLDLKDL